MTLVDRRYSVAEGTAVKAPCRVATTANITLSGLQTIDGVSVVADDRVLVKNQTTGSENGIYACSTGNWTRTRDFDGAYDIVSGTRIFVTSGSASAQVEFYVTTSDPIVVGTTSIAFSAVSTLAVQVAAAVADLVNLGWTGPATFAQTLSVTGNFSVNTNKFTVTASNGNTAIAGTLSATGSASFSSTLSAAGNFAINTDKFTVAASSGNTAIAGSLAVTGASTLTGAIAAASSVLSSSSSAGIGYATNAGGTITQGTNKSTGVTLDKITGTITMNAAALGANTTVSFAVTNSTVAATDLIIVNIKSGGTAASYHASIEAVAAGSFRIVVRNTSGGSLSEALVLSFAVFKGVNS